MLAALRNFQKDIITYMSRNVSDAFEELGFLILKLTIKSVAVALDDVLQEQQGRSDSARGPGKTKYSGLVGQRMPSYKSIEAAVRNNPQAGQQLQQMLEVYLVRMQYNQMRPLLE